MAFEVNGELIDDETIRREAGLVRLHHRADFDDLDPIAAGVAVRNMALDRLIANTLLRQQARKEVLPPEVLSHAVQEIRSESSCVSRFRQAALIEESTAELKLDQLIGKIIARVPKPKRREVDLYYRSNLQRFEVPEMVRASHIVKNVDEAQPEAAARAAIDELARSLAEGADFGKIADERSDCPGDGGDLGWFPRGEMVSEFDHVVFELPIGAVSPAFRTIFGFHIAKLIDRRPERRATLDEVYDQIEDELHRERQRAAVDQFALRLREGASICQVKNR
jgi:parvulin-like peptidyl-prolyl isomerase